jgi:dihydroxyacetone kinase
MGGSSGAVLDIALRAAAVHLKKQQTSIGDGDSISNSDGDKAGWAGALAAAVASVSFYGGAKPGMRTLLDALSPAAEAATAGGDWKAGR